MPHPDDPTQIAFEYSVEADNTGNAEFVAKHEFVDPRGQYALPKPIATEDTDGNGDRWSIKNVGFDLRIAGVRISISQGSENGRSHWNFGWDGSGQYATATFLEDFGVSAPNPYGRESKHLWFPDDARPLWEFKDTLQVSNVTDTAGTGDSTKVGARVFCLPDHEAGNGESRL